MLQNYLGIVVHSQPVDLIDLVHIQILEAMVIAMMMIVLKVVMVTERKTGMGMGGKEIGDIGMMRDMVEVEILSVVMEIGLALNLKNVMEEIITKMMITEEDVVVMITSLGQEIGALKEMEIAPSKMMNVMHLGIFPLLAKFLFYLMIVIERFEIYHFCLQLSIFL